MKNSFLIFILFIFLQTLGCGRKGPYKPEDNETSFMQPVDTLPFSNAIRLILDYAISSREIVDSSEYSLPQIFRFHFYEKDLKNYIYIVQQPAYYRPWATAYFEYQGYMFLWEKAPDAIDNIDPFIDVSKITPYIDTVPGFTDYDYFPPGYYEPLGQLYEIMTPDSLVLVREGYW